MSAKSIAFLMEEWGLGPLALDLSHFGNWSKNSFLLVAPNQILGTGIEVPYFI